MFVEGKDICVDSLGTKSQQRSKVVYAIIPTGRYLQITVVEGTVELIRPSGPAVGAGYRLDVQGSKVLRGGRPYPITTAEVRDSVSWTTFYRTFRPPLPGFDELSPEIRRRPKLDYVVPQGGTPVR